MIVNDIVNMDISTLISQTDIAIGTEKYAKYVIYDRNGIVANGIDDISDDLMNSNVQNYSIELEPDDTEMLLVRINIQDSFITIIEKIRKKISDSNDWRTFDEYQEIINEYRREKYGR